MRDIKNVDAYLRVVTGEFRGQSDAGFENPFEGQQALWRAAVIVWEVADTPAPWLDRLREIALDTLRPWRIESTIQSAHRRAASHD